MFICNNSRDYVFFTRRLCARRILRFLKKHYLEAAAHQMERETAVFFDLSHLQYLARGGRWDELTSYVTYFMPPCTERPSREGSTFLKCLNTYRVLGWIAAGGKKAEDVDTLYPLLDEAAAKADPYTAAFNTFYHTVKRHPPRDFATWLKIWEDGAEKLKYFALKCPEIKGKLHLPKYAPKHCQINLCGVRPVQRLYKRKVNKQTAYDIARFFKKQKQQEDIGKSSSVPLARSPFQMALIAGKARAPATTQIGGIAASGTSTQAAAPPDGPTIQALASQATAASEESNSPAERADPPGLRLGQVLGSLCDRYLHGD